MSRLDEYRSFIIEFGGCFKKVHSASLLTNTQQILFRMADPRIKQLRIKTGILKRCCKEKISYEKEADQIQDKIKKMQDEGQDVYYIKKQDVLLQETQSVILDCQKRLNTAYQDLKTLVDAESELEEAEEYVAAKTVIEETSAHITA